VRRHAIGIIAIVLLLGAAVLWIWPLEVGWHEPLKAACSRLGPFMVALWLAYHEVERLPRWILATVPLLILVLVLRPKWFFFALPIVILMVILRPKPR